MVVKQNTLNFILDVATFAAFLALVASGLMLRFVLPPRSGALSVWGASRHDWGDVHFWIATSVGALLLFHVALHWSWACGMIQRMLSPGPSHAADPHMRALSGVLSLVFVIAAMALFVYSALNSVKIGPVAHLHGQARSGRQLSQSSCNSSLEFRIGGPGTVALYGRMTLRDVSAAVGMPLDKVRDCLGLDESESAESRLGPILRDYSMTLSEARARLAIAPTSSG